MVQNHAEEMDAGQAFEALRVEVALLRRAVEGLAAERQAVPDYSPTLVQISSRLEGIVGWAKRIAEQPAFKLSPTELAQDIKRAGHEVREADRRAVQDALAGLEGQIKQVKDALRCERTAADQGKVARICAASGFTLGILLWSFVPGTVARTLPAGWYLPERMAAGIMGVNRWEAGQRMMASHDPDAWQGIVEADRHSRAAKRAGRKAARD